MCVAQAAPMTHRVWNLNENSQTGPRTETEQKLIDISPTRDLIFVEIAGYFLYYSGPGASLGFLYCRLYQVAANWGALE